MEVDLETGARPRFTDHLSWVNVTLDWHLKLAASLSFSRC